MRFIPLIVVNSYIGFIFFIFYFVISDEVCITNRANQPAIVREMFAAFLSTSLKAGWRLTKGAWGRRMVLLHHSSPPNPPCFRTVGAETKKCNLLYTP